jgi:5S rRNA maturation endonuclease (ribonuclease M5)
MQKKSRSIDQAKLKVVCDDLCDNIESLMDNLGLEYNLRPKMLSMACPIHDGDNSSALNIYYEGDNYRGNWKCRTHGCEECFKGSIIGFVRGVLSNKKHGWQKQGDSTCTFDEALDYCLTFLKKDLKQIKISKADRDKRLFTSLVGHMKSEPTPLASALVSRDSVRKSLTIPAQYFIDRGFSPEILDKYDVGVCDKQGKEMFNRAVAPIYDHDHKYLVGCSGRSIFEKCDKCKSHHNPIDNCPTDEEKWKYSKWKHNHEFKSQNYLYNFWFAKKQILDSGIVIIVESPGNVWKLEENHIHNSVAMFGSSLSDRQKIILDSSGAMNIVILTDNDEAGKKAAEQIKNKCQNTYRIFIPQISKPDIAEMTPDEIKKEIVEYMGKII